MINFLKRNSQNIDQTKPVLVFAHAQSKFGYQIDKFNGIFYKKIGWKWHKNNANYVFFLKINNDSRIQF